MSKNYRVIITPLEPYTLGTEQGSKYAKVQNQGKESYIIASSEVPEQTTVLGALRYIVLSHHGKLKSDFTYSDAEKAEMDALIGPQSFAFGTENQNFGRIESVSPLFLVEGDKTYVKNPFCNKAKSGYEPYAMETEAVMTSRGRMQLPGEDYRVKEGYGYGYICLQDKSVVTDLFTKILAVGNRADHADRDNKEGFFKREMVILKKGFSFAVYVKAEEGTFPASTIAYMGRKKSAFRFVFTEVDDAESIEAQVETAFADFAERWFYALSDIYAPQVEIGDSFAIIESKKIRNLETVATGKDYITKRKKSIRISLIKAGSVFKAEPQFGKNANCETAGYNKIIVLGGKK